MLRSWRVRWLLLVAVVGPAWLAQMQVSDAATRAHVGTKLEQCANTPSGVGDCTGSAWITGALNPNKALYGEGEFVPFRAVLTGLTAGVDYALGIGYDAVDNGLHAYDYLGTFDASESAPGQLVVPCDGVAGTAGSHACGTGSTPGPPSTLDVPDDTNTHFPSGGQLEGMFSAWGGHLKSAAYVSPTPIDVTTTGTVARVIDVSFTADGDTVVLAWGGHLASNVDWGAGNTFLGNHSGASFHMRLASTDSIQTGNEELAMQGDVIASAPAPFTTHAQPSPVGIGQTVTDTATLGPTTGAPPHGSIAFFVCFSSAAAPDCRMGGMLVGHSEVVVSARRAGRPRGTSSGVAAIDFAPAAVGYYCFRAEYSPAVGTSYSPTSHTDMTTECFQATPPPATLTVTKICDPTGDRGLFNLLIDGGVVFANAPCGASTGQLIQAPGTHTVSETEGTGTNLADYTTTIGGDCAVNGSVTLAAGQSKTCTITNVRLPPPPTATLTVNKVCQPASDPGRFDLYIDANPFPDVPCGAGTGPVTISVGPHTVSEQGGSDTSLADYTSVIGGDCAADGSIMLTAGQSATCTITNTRLPPPPTTITVVKACIPANDPGRFNLTIDGDVAGTGANVACGGTTGTVDVHPGVHQVGETAATATDLADYTTIIGGDCATDGSVAVASGDQATCTITNVREAPTPQPFAILTVNKICIPASDGGIFNLSINQHVETNEPCGGNIGPLAVPVGTQQVGETAGTGTDLANYTTTIGGDCAAGGSITLSNGQSAICTITNERTQPLPPEPTPEPTPPPTATIEIKKICVPASDKHRFTLQLDNQPLPEMACGQTTGPMETATGFHVVGELAGPHQQPPGAYTTVIGGDCGANGTITLTAGQHALCTVTNTHSTTRPPTHPPTICNTLAVTPRTLTAGNRATILAHVAAAGKPVLGALVTLTGAGVSSRRTTTSDGIAHFPIKPAATGILTLATQRQYGCEQAAKDQVGVTKPSQPKPPSVTG